MVDSLWGEEFSVEDTKEKTKKIINKISKPKELKVTVEKQVRNKKLSIEEKLKIIADNVLEVLGKQKENVLVIQTSEQFSLYIDEAIKNGIIAIDTETNNSLDPITCNLMGLCIYTNGQKQAYIPVNHTDLQGNRLEWQLTEEDIRIQLQRLIDANVKIIMHNGKFDYQVIKCTCGIELPIYWDTMIGSKLLDENEFSAGLKQQYIGKVDPEQEKYSIDHLFSEIEYRFVDPWVFSLYAATDALMTMKLYDYQMQFFTKPENARLFNLALEVEMPCIIVTAEMELQGVDIDQEYAKRLQSKYHKKLDALDAKIQKCLDDLKPEIDAWRLTPDATKQQKKELSEKQYANAKKSENFDGSLYSFVDSKVYKISKSKLEQLGDKDLTPNDLGSTVKLGILLYDILKCPVVNKEKPRATGEDELKKLKDKAPLCKLMLERREQVKLLTSFIDTLPNMVNPKDGRIHGHFNQYGAATGRFSSSEPNLQQIPSHNKEIRMLFRAKPGCILIGSDFSQQEPRLLSQFSQDENMINAYVEGKDLYATIATGVYHNNYEDNLENMEILVKTDPHTEIITDVNNSFKLLLDDEIKLNNINKKAIDINIGDKIETSDGLKEVINKVVNTVYCTITVK